MSKSTSMKLTSAERKERAAGFAVLFFGGFVAGAIPHPFGGLVVLLGALWLGWKMLLRGRRISSELRSQWGAVTMGAAATIISCASFGFASGYFARWGWLDGEPFQIEEYAFGMTPDDFRSRCTASGAQSETTRLASGAVMMSCGKAPSRTPIDAPAVGISATFCEQQACSLSLLFEANYEELARKISGAPTVVVNFVPDVCRDAELSACFADGRARRSRYWNDGPRASARLMTLEQISASEALLTYVRADERHRFE